VHLTSCTVAATCVLIKQGELLVANLGDSRAVASVGGVVKQLTQDHNTSNPRERERVTAMGGVIKDNRVGGVLMPTRLLQFFFNSEKNGIFFSFNRS
jgi:protein phosphatase 2C family protein 2/3